MDNEIENLIKSERGMALLGIASHQSQSETTTACISDEEMISFISHNVTKKQREKIFAHLNRCSKCYNNWLETASYVKQESPSTSNRWWNFQMPIWQPLITSVAATILIVTVIILLPSNNSINQDDELINSLGFNDENHSSASQAFKAGINGQQASSTTEYELGRWFRSLKLSATQSVTNDFWAQQIKLLEKFETSEYSCNEDMKQAIMQALTTIKPLLLDLQDDPNNIYKAEQLVEKLEFFMASIEDF